MASSDVIIGVALDHSGSMIQGGDEVVAGFNAFREEQIAAPGHAYMTLVIFDGRAYTRFVAGKLADIPELGTKGNEYNPGGSTPLYDGVRLAIVEVDEFLKDNPTFDGSKIVLVFTDGEENASTTTTLAELNDLMSRRKEDGWEFIFMGSGGAAWTEGKNLAVAQTSQVQMSNNVQSFAAYGAVSNSMTNLRSSGGVASMDSTLAKFSAAAGLTPPDDEDDEDEEEMPHRGADYHVTSQP